jgi:kynurenine formamidase
LLYCTGVSTLWSEGTAFLTQYSGLDDEASRWILDQGVINILTDAPSTDNPADLSYPNHTACAEYLVNHTEIVANIDRIPVHQGFSIMVIPLRLMRCSASPVRVFALWEDGS